MNTRSDFEHFLAASLRESRNELTARWLERLVARIDVEPNRVFPSDDLLDHMPLLIVGVADHLDDPSSSPAAEAAVLDRAMQLGALRYGQGFDEYEIVKEFEIFGGILLTFLLEKASAPHVEQPASAVIECTRRLYQAIARIQEAALGHFLQLMRQRVVEREDRLRAFNRALTHEFRNRIGAAMGAGQILDLPGLDDGERSRLVSVVVRNMQTMRLVLDNLLELTRSDVDTRQQRHVRLREAVAESTRHLRDMAAAGGVRIEMVGPLPDVEVPAAAVELCLTNLVSNAVKYADPRESDRWVRISGRSAGGEADYPAVVEVEVRDNGIGVPAADREKLFTRLFRASNAVDAGVDGTGLGLSIVRETLASFGGQISADFSAKGSSFRVMLPSRRVADYAALGLQPPNPAEQRR